MVDACFGENQYLLYSKNGVRGSARARMFWSNTREDSY